MAKKGPFPTQIGEKSMVPETVMTHQKCSQTKKRNSLTLLLLPPMGIQTKKQSCNKLPKLFLLPSIYNLATSFQVSSWLPPHRLLPKCHLPLPSPQTHRQERQQQEDSDHWGEEGDKVCRIPSTPLLGPLEEEVWVEEGGILEEEVVTLEETLEEVEGIPHRLTINYQGHNPPSLKGIDANQKDSSKNGTSIVALISSLPTL